MERNNILNYGGTQYDDYLRKMGLGFGSRYCGVEFRTRLSPKQGLFLFRDINNRYYEQIDILGG